MATAQRGAIRKRLGFARSAHRTELGVEPPHEAEDGWLLRLRFANLGEPGTFEAQITAADSHAGSVPWILAWRPHGARTSAFVAAKDHEILRLAYLYSGTPRPTLGFLTEANNPRDWQVLLERTEPFRVTLQIRHVESDAWIAAYEITITANRDDSSPPTVTTRPTRLVRGMDPKEPATSDPPVELPQIELPQVELPPIEVDTAFLEAVLRCSACSSTLSAAADGLECNGCGAWFPIVDGVAVMLEDDSVATKLENIDYDAVHGITHRTILTVGREWKQLIDGLGVSPTRAIEIGSGTGALTRGLLYENVVEHVTATDISPLMLRQLTARTAEYRDRLALVACDANQPHFEAGSFDLVVGRSILHHLLDYKVTLKVCRSLLQPGGIAIFHEPVLEGKAIVALMLALILRSEETSDGSQFSPADRDKIRRQIRHLTKSKVIGDDRDALAKMEDKYIFGREQLRRDGVEAGFRDVTFASRGDVEPGYWAHTMWHLQVMGVKPVQAEPYRWISEEFARTYALLLEDQIVSPMGFFVFWT